MKRFTKIKVKEIKPETIITTPYTLEFCRRPYPDHPDGCPNVDKCRDLDLDFFKDKWEHYYLVYGIFDFKSYKEYRSTVNPNWTGRQVRCVLYWQNSVKRILRDKIEELYVKEGPFYVYVCGSGMSLSFQDKVGSMELAGINVFSTMKLNGIEFEVKPETRIVLCNLLCCNHTQTRF